MSAAEAVSRVDPLDAAREQVRRALSALAADAAGEGMPRIEVRGQLIRPLAALASARALGAENEATWRAALAVQLAHEASLVHDDIVDGAATRRGQPTLAAAAGVGAALVLGDHLLAWAYRMAARAGSLAFAERFAAAVERTVAGEVAQGRGIGWRLERAAYERIALDKAGALLGCALAAAPSIAGRDDAGCFDALGGRLGLLYQMLDDLLDYCPSEDAGKPALGDYAQRRWTWVLDALPGIGFGEDPREVADALHRPGAAGDTPMRRALARLEDELAAFDRQRTGLMPDDAVLAPLAAGWLARARAAVAREEASRRASDAVLVAAPVRAAESIAIVPRSCTHALPRSRTSVSRRIRDRVPAPAEWAEHLARGSRSFSFASRFFPAAERKRVARVYAFCRVTDDLVDRPEGESSAALEAVLDEWEGLALRAYGGQATGIALLDAEMGEMAERGVPFAYAAGLVEGMRMDLRGRRYASLAELREYTYRAASVVGLWLTELFGVHDAPTLRKAAALGHAMQLTNVLRDVGEDLRAGRVYLPADAMARHGVTVRDLWDALAGHQPIRAGYTSLVEELISAADAGYREAFAAIPRLPAFFQRPVAVAAHVYRGIHASIRRNGYDNLRRRAHTTPPEKAVLAARALWELRAARRRSALHPGAGDAVRLAEQTAPAAAAGR